ncbi:hypothetical protein [Streptomyces sp. SID5789]|uniref:hypothetical protein n=1 Tax=Streptomyces sp. SID5789 TaxID=2690310 RepID=UPI001370AC95|nr:hypothetical protein [Streptomyces sp. SID5789]MZE75196.1 hypothetical protein [Streptomyces sp. SID5789]
MAVVGAVPAGGGRARDGRGLFLGRRRPDWRAPIGTALKIAVVVLLAIVVLAVVTALHQVPAAVTWTQLGAVVLVAVVVLLLSGGGFYLERKRPAWREALDAAVDDRGGALHRAAGGDGGRRDRGTAARLTAGRVVSAAGAWGSAGRRGTAAVADPRYRSRGGGRRGYGAAVSDEVAPAGASVLPEVDGVLADAD